MQYPFSLLSCLTNIFLLIWRKSKSPWSNSQKTFSSAQTYHWSNHGILWTPLSLGALCEEWRSGTIWGTRYSYWENKQRPLDILQPFWDRRHEAWPCNSHSSPSSSPWSLRCEWRHCLMSFKHRSMRQHLVHTGRKRLQRCLLFIPFDVATKRQAHCEASHNRGRTKMTDGLSEKTRPNQE